MERLIKTKSKFYKFTSFLFSLMFLILTFVPCLIKTESYFLANALPDSRINEEQTEPDNNQDNENEGSETNPDENYIDYTIFIRNATFSTIYNDNAYIIDKEINDDETVTYTLKTYNIQTAAFEQVYMVLNDITNIIDAEFIDGYFIVLAENGLFMIQLNTNAISEKTACKNIDISSASINLTDYAGISTYKFSDTSTEEYFLMLTPKFSEETEDETITSVDPKILILDNTFTYKDIVTVNVEIATTSPLFKFFAISGKTESSINLVFVYDSDVYYFRTDRNTMKSELSAGSSNKFNTQLDTTDSTVDLDDTDIIICNEVPYLITTYIKNYEDYSETYAYVYELSIDIIDNVESTYLTKRGNFKLNAFTDHTTTSDNIFIYSSDQVIHYVKIEVENLSEVSLIITSDKITNPKIEIEYFSEDNFIYSQTNANCYILTAPWTPKTSEGATLMNEKLDVIVIGRGYITSNGKQYLKDYTYCLFTINDINYKGFVESDKLTEKRVLVESNELTLIKYNKILKAKPNASLYSLPTKVIGDKITSELTSKIIENIKDNSRIEFLNDIYCYTSNNSMFLKVKVNDKNIGYIEFDSIITPSSSNNFVLTNSYIKQNGTKVYLEENENSPIIYLLETDKRIRINGTRNSKTGFTYITFNDEFGNEFSGYIKNEMLKSDHWSTLQIIGCVLIAINIGLLILIVYFKNRKIGSHGEGYTNSKKSN